MSAEHDTETGHGIRSAIGWPIGGVLGGVIGAAVFGLLMWLFDPDIVAAAIPALFGLDPAGVTGWAIHLAHGAVLGLVFGFIATRAIVLEAIRVNAETDTVSETGEMARVVGAGLAYGLAIWAIIPVIVLPIWIDAIGTEAAGEFPAIAVESMVGHAIFGLVLGAVFAATVDLRDRPTEGRLET